MIDLRIIVARAQVKAREGTRKSDGREDALVWDVLSSRSKVSSPPSFWLLWNYGIKEGAVDLRVVVPKQMQSQPTCQ
jgi:hypothetical protein